MVSTAAAIRTFCSWCCLTDSFALLHTSSYTSWWRWYCHSFSPSIYSISSARRSSSCPSCCSIAAFNCSSRWYCCSRGWSWIYRSIFSGETLSGDDSEAADTPTIACVLKGAGARDSERVTRLESEATNELATRFLDSRDMVQGLDLPRPKTVTAKSEAKRVKTRLKLRPNPYTDGKRLACGEWQWWWRDDSGW